MNSDVRVYAAKRSRVLTEASRRGRQHPTHDARVHRRRAANRRTAGGGTLDESDAANPEYDYPDEVEGFSWDSADFDGGEWFNQGVTRVKREWTPSD